MSVSVCVENCLYVYSHYSSWDTEALRNWQFQASNEELIPATSSSPGNANTRWTVLREHKEDAALDMKGATFTWKLKAAQSYRFFRSVVFIILTSSIVIDQSCVNSVWIDRYGRDV